MWWKKERKLWSVCRRRKFLKQLPDMDEDNATAEDTEAIYRLVAAVLNNNMGKVPVTEEDVADYDIEECTAILNAYMEFVNELKQNPN